MSDPDWFICGYWRDRSAVAGKPAVVSGTVGQGKVVYSGSFAATPPDRGWRARLAPGEFRRLFE